MTARVTPSALPGAAAPTGADRAPPWQRGDFLGQKDRTLNDRPGLRVSVAAPSNRFQT